MLIGEELQTALKCQQEGDFRRAEHIYKKILKKYPDNFDSLHMLGVMAAHAGKNDLAKTYLKKALQSNPRSFYAHFNLGNIFKQSGQPEKAVPCYQKAVELNPAFARAYYELGGAYADTLKELSARAMSFFQKALSRNAGFSEELSYFPIVLDYPVNPTPRYGYGKLPHEKLYEIINTRRDSYRHSISLFRKYDDFFIQIPRTGNIPAGPAWINGWLPGLDGVLLYGFLALNNPATYCEIGSGNSTLFARQAIQDQGLRTKIVSVDPRPRADIDAICDEVIRQPAEDIAVTRFDALDAGDILFVDNSHRVFMNSDVTAVFLDILPRLKQGVIVALHDIFLPYDYPPAWKDRYYSEQYLLAACLLGGCERFELLLPAAFVSNDDELREGMASLWKKLDLDDGETGGSSFWMRTR
ncbi:MAG: tetratricopeptide repeat protein [Nitrospirota bacterium]